MFQDQFTHITQLIQDAKKRIFQVANQETVTLYWQIGDFVSHQVSSKAWGKSVVKELSEFIQKSEPNIIGFSPQNIWRMKQFYETYYNASNLSPLVREISWTHHLFIIGLKTLEEREFYIRMTIKEKWSKRELKRQINSSYFERIMISNVKLSPLARVLPQDITYSFKDTYVL